MEGVLADQKELALEGVLVNLRVGGDEHLLDHRLGGFGAGANLGIVGGHRAPAQKLLVLVGNELFQDELADLLIDGVARQEHVPHGVVAGVGKLDAQVAPGDLGEEGVGRGGEDAGAITGVDFASTGAAVVHVLEHLDGIENNLVAGRALEMGDEAHAAGVFLEGRVIETLLGGQAGVDGSSVSMGAGCGATSEWDVVVGLDRSWKRLASYELASMPAPG